MEKVTFEPLLELLKQNADNLDQSLRTAMSATPAFRTAEITGWVLKIIEPVFKAFHSKDAGRNNRILDILWRDMLSALGRREIFENIAGATAVRLLLTVKPALFQQNPAGMLKALASAYLRICAHSTEAAAGWLIIMEKVISSAHDSQEILPAGRLAAWKCGMAHLFPLLIDSPKPSPAVLDIIFAENGAKPETILQRWPKKNPEPAAAGSFTGFNGNFVKPPRICLYDNLIFASDGSSCAVLFADCHGAVLCECSEAFIEILEFILPPATNAPAAAGKILAGYPDLTSWVCHEQTLYLTTASSHAIFIFGAVDA